MPSSRNTAVYLGLGSNLGDREAHLEAAVHGLEARGVQVVRASRVYATAYVGEGPPQPEYLNAVVEARTALEPEALLAAVHAVEVERGRGDDSHGLPRPLDIDILTWGERRIDRPGLHIPHPRLATRRFVLEPLAELGALPPGLAPALASLREAQTVRPIGALRGVGHAEPQR